MFWIRNKKKNFWYALLIKGIFDCETTFFPCNIGMLSFNTVEAPTCTVEVNFMMNMFLKRLA